jgi:hypothetical protein
VTRACGPVLVVVAGTVSITVGAVRSTVTRKACDGSLVTPETVAVAVKLLVPAGRVVPE